MPRERSDFFRESSIIEREQIFVIAFEGNETEPQYFDAIKTHNHFNGLIYLKTLQRKKGDTNSAPKHVLKQILDYKSEYNFDNRDELWIVIDRDRWHDLDGIADQCIDNNVLLALSNPCIEIWFYLHFQDVQLLTDEEKENIKSNKKVTNNKTYLDQLLSNLFPDSYNKTKLNAQFLLDNLSSAITNAEALHTNLEEKYPTEIGSHLYILLRRLVDIDKIIT